MKIFTREELEDIWNNKPYGYFTELRKKKDLNKYKKYIVEAKILRDCGTKRLVVHDTNANGIMVSNARNILREQILNEFGNDVQINYKTLLE